MDLSESDEQQFLRESVRGTVTREAGLPTVREWVLEGAIDHRAAAELAVRQGWTGIGIPEELGGQGGGTIELAILAEELGRGAVPADSLYATLLTALALAGCDAAHGEVEAIADGSAPAALALPADRALDAPSGGTGPSLVLGAQAATRFVGLDGLDGDRLWIALAEQAEVEAVAMVDHTRSLATTTVAADARTQLGELSPAARERLAAQAAVIVAADALGASTRMLELTVEYVNQRQQFGVFVGSFQAVKHMAAEMLVAIEGTRAVLQYAAWAVGAGEPGAHTDAWVAKARASRTASFVADKALFLHGAVGYTWEHDLQLLFKRAKSDALLFGGAGANDERIADGLELVGD
jgi:alkylation response protein AidB-like acyl-CoA dehydrogenase